jgi:hypothetical protein
MPPELTGDVGLAQPGRSAMSDLFSLGQRQLSARPLAKIV